MPETKTTEREFAIKLIGWLNEFIKQGNYSFEQATGEASLKVGGNKTKFPDVQIWLNRQAGMGFCGWELKTPETSANDQTLLDNALEKANAMNASFFVTWNMREAIIWRLPAFGYSVTRECRVWSYKPISQITNADDLWVTSKQILLKEYAKAILDDLAKLHKDGHLYEVETDTTFFVKLLNDAVSQLAPLLKEALMRKIAEKNFSDGLKEWANKQGIANFEDDPFRDATSRQLIYRILGKIILYQTLRRYRNDLPALDLSQTPDKKVTDKLNEYFNIARAIDYQAVFEEGFSDKVGIPDKAAFVLKRLISDLNRYNFSRMPQEVIGSVFEKLITPEDRHRLGQYFTREDLVDIINTFCIRGPKDNILDPTCGSGTFLSRAYNRLQMLGERDHKKLLNQLWGVDIAHFPAELATINIYRQNLSDYANFPRIVCEDFFDIKPQQTFKFPPPKPDINIPHIEKQMPLFDGIVGNFPYIRHELIEKTDPVYKQKLIKVHQKDWLKDYPDFFDENHLPNLSGKANIYISLFFHTTKFLKSEEGRIGIVTSNAWLDTDYGYELQKFFLKHFKIIAILESRCEPWFEDAAVNTIVTVLERCTKQDLRNRHIVKFIKIKKPLKKLIPWDLKDPVNRWSGIQRLINKIEETGKEYYKQEGAKIVNTLKGLATKEDDNFRIRLIRQEELLNEVTKSVKTAKWGKYLRAPEVYFETIRMTNKFVPIGQYAESETYLNTGGNDKFFFLTEEEIKHWNLPRTFLTPMIKSSDEISDLVEIRPNYKTKWFILTIDGKKYPTKEKLPVSVRDYVKSAGKIPDNWNSLPKQAENGGPLLIGRTVNDTHIIWCNPKRIVTNRFYRIYPRNNRDIKLLSAVLNSSLFALIRELNSPLEAGEGALNTYDIDELLIPDLGVFKNNKQKVIEAFNKLKVRSIKPVTEEVENKDRQNLDSLILKALGVDPKKYLQPLYDGLCELVRERLDLAKMRKKVKSGRQERDTDKVKQEVIEEILSDGPKKFPGDFAVIPDKIKYNEVSVPKEPLKLGKHLPLYRVHEVITDDGFCYKAKTEAEARFIIYSQKPDEYIVRMPEDRIVIEKAVSGYEKYLNDLRTKLHTAFAGRVFDHKLADALTHQVFAEFNLPIV